MKSCRFLLGFVYLAFCCTAFAQSTNASLTGFVDDPSKAVIPKVSITAINTQTGVKTHTLTNSSGEYVLPALSPGTYRIEVDKQGFKGIIEAGLVLHVQDVVQINFHMAVGSMSESVTVNADAVNVNIVDGTVSTVVGREFVENIPLNGRSFQSLLSLVPGVFAVPAQITAAGYSGTFVVNGQRTEANYFTVDGVSANSGAASGSSFVSAGYSGSLPAQSALGTTQTILPVDALEEFRASTSTYSAEFGRSPGGQFSFASRAGTNEWHGSAFEYMRNEVADAANWFNGYTHHPALPKTKERQNDFGGTVGGPLTLPRLYSGMNRSFFFFSYEGLRLRVPQVSTNLSVPDAALRQQAPAALLGILNAFPLPNQGEDGLNDGLGIYSTSISYPSALDNLGIRIDHQLNSNLKVFGRYARTRSDASTYLLAVRTATAQDSDSVTFGATATIGPRQTNSFHFGWTANDSSYSGTSTSLGGATPFDIGSIPGPDGTFPKAGSSLSFYLQFGGQPNFTLNSNLANQKQYQVTDSHTLTLASHQLKFGVDWREISTYTSPYLTSEFVSYSAESKVLSNTPSSLRASSSSPAPVEPVYPNFSAYAQDEWRITNRFTILAGVRWDVNPAPHNSTGPSPYTLDQITNLVTAKLAPQGTPLWSTQWTALAPRFGAAFHFNDGKYMTAVRGGVGLFYDTGNNNGSLGFNAIGFSSSTSASGPFPLTSAQLKVPAPSVSAPYQQQVEAFDPNLRLPFTTQGNLALEQSIGEKQTVSMTYVGAKGTKLLTRFFYYADQLGNHNFGTFVPVAITNNEGSSSFNSLQLQFKRVVAHGLNVLSSYTWSHSIDDASTNANSNQLLRGDSDFDVRHNFQLASTYDTPTIRNHRISNALLSKWGLDIRLTAQTGIPVNIVGNENLDPTTQAFYYYQPNLVPGQPLYLYGAQYPGGRSINYAAFSATANGLQGNVPRNYARALGAIQPDVSLRRSFVLIDKLALNLRLDAFNVVNHPNFAPPIAFSVFGPRNFGVSTDTLNSTGGLSSLYQVGGPRSLQLSARFSF